MEKLPSCGNGESVHLDTFNHREEAVGARGREMLGKPDFTNEIEVGIQNLLCRMAVDYTEEEGDDSLHNEGIAFSAELEKAVCSLVAHNPDAALTTVDEVRLVLFFGREDIALFAQINEQLVAVHPIFNLGKFLDDFVLYFVDGHIRVLYFE